MLCSFSEARLSQPRLHDVPSGVDQWRFCWLRYLKELRVPLWVVSETAPGEDEEQHHKGAEYHDIIPVPASVDEGARPFTDDELRDGDEQDKQTIGCIAKTMGERCDQHTSFRVIEDPGVEKRGGNRNDEETYVVGEAERSEQPRKERGQMPQAVQRAEDDGPQDGAVALLQPRQRKSTPAQFFCERRRQNGEHGLWEEHGEEERPLQQERKGQVHPIKDAELHPPDREKAENGDQVPPDAHPPLHTPAQQQSQACSARGDGGHAEGCQGRPGRGSEHKSNKKRDIWDPEGKDAKPIHISGKREGQQEGPGPRECDDEVGHQRMTPDKTLE